MAAGVISNPIQHRLWCPLFARRQQAGEVDPSDDVTVDRRYLGNQVGVPNVCIDLAFDEFELIQLINLAVTVSNGNLSDPLKRAWVTKCKRGCSVAGD